MELRLFLQTFLTLTWYCLSYFHFTWLRCHYFRKVKGRKNLCLVLNFNLKFNYRVNQNYLFIPSNGFFSFFLFKSFVYLFLSNFKILYWHIDVLTLANNLIYIRKSHIPIGIIRIVIQSCAFIEDSLATQFLDKVEKRKQKIWSQSVLLNNEGESQSFRNVKLAVCRKITHISFKINKPYFSLGFISIRGSYLFSWKYFQIFISLGQ